MHRLGRAHRYHPKVFFAAPWPQIYVNDPERRHDFAAAEAEAERLADAYTALGYQIVMLPKTGVRERADFVLSSLATSGA